MIAQAWTRITLSDGTTAKIDARDEGFFSRFRWKMEERGVACRTEITIKGKRTSHRVYLARLLMMASDADYVLFRNGDPLDCRTCNLIKITRSKYLKLKGKIGINPVCNVKDVFEKGGVYSRRIKRKDGSVYQSWHVRLPLFGEKSKKLSSCASTKEKAEQILHKWRVKHAGPDTPLCAWPEDIYDGNADYAGQWGSDFESLSMMSHVFQRDAA